MSNTGPILPVTLARHLGLGELVTNHVDLGDAPGRANAGDKLLTLAASALAGWRLHRRRRAARWGDRAGAGRRGQGAIHSGDLPEEFPVGSRAPAGSGERELLVGAWAAGAGPGDDPLTIDLDSTVRETYGLCKEGAQHHNYTGQRGYHPLLAIAAGTGDVLMARLRKGRSNTARGAAHFLRETVSRVSYAGTTGPLTVRADSGFYNHDIVAACRKMNVRFSITIRHRLSVRNIIEAVPEAEWTPYPTVWRAPPTWPRPRTFLSRMSPTPRRAPHGPSGETHAWCPASTILASTPPRPQQSRRVAVLHQSEEVSRHI